MKINFFFDLCGFIIIGILILADFFKKTCVGRANKIFFVNLIFLFFAALSRLVYSGLLANAPYTMYIRNCCYVMIYTYIFLLILASYATIYYIYSFSGLWNIIKTKKLYRFFVVVLNAVPFLLVLCNIPSNKLFYISGAMEYFKNPACVLIPFSITVSIFFGIAVFIRFKKLIRCSSILLPFFLLIINICMAVIYCFVPFFINANIFILSVSCYLVLLFTKIPELSINSMVDSKTEKTFFNDCFKFFNFNIEGKVLFIKITNHKNLSLYIGQENYSAYLRFISQKIKACFPDKTDDFELYYLNDSLFAVASEDEDNKIGALAEKINSELTKKTDFRKFELFPQLSVCLLRLPDDIEDFEFFYYFTKNFHKVIGSTYSPVYIKNVSSSKEFRIKSSIEKILKNALTSSRFEVFYQPVWSVEHKKFICAEALVRLKDEELGYIPPSIFIPAAESNGDIHKIGDFVLKEVCRFISSPEFKKAGLQFIEINLSTAQCIESNLVDNILRTISEYGVAPEQLRFEITENSADFNPFVVEQNITLLHKAGIKIALDDYGTGYSNIERVIKLPFDIIKLDKAFVDEMDDSRMWIVIRDTIQMLVKLGKEIFIEGIDNESSAKCFENLRLNNELVCRYIQGYYYSSPIPKDEFLTFLEHRNSRTAD